MFTPSLQAVAIASCSVLLIHIYYTFLELDDTGTYLYWHWEMIRDILITSIGLPRVGEW